MRPSSIAASRESPVRDRADDAEDREVRFGLWLRPSFAWLRLDGAEKLIVRWRRLKKVWGNYFAHRSRACTLCRVKKYIAKRSTERQSITS